MRNAWTKADLHVHTTCSDGHASVREVVEHAARQTDLPVIAITDHNTIEGALQARTLAREYRIEVVVGEEVSTADGELLALFIERRLAPGRPAAETIAAVHEQGGLCVAAHPYAGLAGLCRCTPPRRRPNPMSIQRPTTGPPTGVFPRVVVIGAGTGGLCLAQGLKRVGIPVAIYERDRTRTDGLPPDLYNNTRATSTGASPPPRAGFPQAS